MFLIILRIHLKAVIGQMNKFALIIEGICVRTCSEVKLFVEIKVFVVVYQCQNSNIKLSALIQQRSLDVFLNDKLGIMTALVKMAKHLLI